MRNRMKIGLVLANSPRYSEVFLRYKILGLQKSGFQVILFCREIESDWEICPIVRLPRKSKNPFYQFYSVVREFLLLIPYWGRVRKMMALERKDGFSRKSALKKVYWNAPLLRADLDWIHFGFSTLALERETVAAAIGAKMGVSFRGFDISIYPLKNPGCFERLWKYADKIHTISDDLIKIAEEKSGLPPHIPIYKIPPAIDVEFFKTKEEKLPGREIVFMTTGRLHWKKGYVSILEALAELKKEGFSFIYKIAGEGEERERIAFAIHDLGLEKEVRLLGRIPHFEVRSHLETADIYIQYSIQEGFSNGVLEAQAMGKLCVVSDAEGLSENVLHQETGWVVPKNRPDLLAETLKMVLQLPPEEIVKFQNAAGQRVRTYFSLERQREEFEEFFKG